MDNKRACKMTVICINPVDRKICPIDFGSLEKNRGEDSNIQTTVVSTSGGLSSFVCVGNVKKIVYYTDAFFEGRTCKVAFRLLFTKPVD